MGDKPPTEDETVAFLTEFLESRGVSADLSERLARLFARDVMARFSDLAAMKRHAESWTKEDVVRLAKEQREQELSEEVAAEIASTGKVPKA